MVTKAEATFLGHSTVLLEMGGTRILTDPALINRDPEGDGWFFKLKLSDASEVNGLMDEAAYREWVKTL